jgi:hypothetical protein
MPIINKSNLDDAMTTYSVFWIDEREYKWIRHSECSYRNNKCWYLWIVDQGPYGKAERCIFDVKNNIVGCPLNLNPDLEINATLEPVTNKIIIEIVDNNRTISKLCDKLI